jgi:phage antirepressor YoqD-like protein
MNNNKQRLKKEEAKQHVEFMNNNIDKLDKAIESFKQDSLNQFLSTSSVMIKDPQKWEIPKQETLEEAIKQELENHFFSNISEIKQAEYFINFGAKWQQEQICKSEFLQRLRATISDAEARRLIFEQFKNNESN